MGVSQILVSVIEHIGNIGRYNIFTSLLQVVLSLEEYYTYFWKLI